MAELGVPLAAAIRVLRGELLEAMRAGEGELLRFGLGPVELELQVDVSSEGGGEAGIKFWLLSLGASGKRSTTDSHTVRLTLEPVDASGKKVLIADDTAVKPGEAGGQQ